MKKYSLQEIPRWALFAMLGVETLILLGFFVWVIMW